MAAQRENFAVLDIAPAEMDRRGRTTDLNAECVPKKSLRREHGTLGIADSHEIMLFDRAALDAFRRHNPSAAVISMGMFHIISIKWDAGGNIGRGLTRKTAGTPSASGR